MLTKINQLTRDQRGASLIEYVLLIGVIALFAIAGFKAFGGSINTKIQEQSDAVKSINGAAH